MYTKYNYIYTSMIEILYSYMSVYTNLPKYNPLPVLQNVFNSGSVERACLEFREAAAVAIFAVKSNALPGLLKTFFASFFDTLSPFLPRFLKKSPRLSAFIVSSLTVIDFFCYRLNKNRLVLYYL